jgi:ABC-type branched-subunit amino acid transport system substrate-binding protein
LHARSNARQSPRKEKIKGDGGTWGALLVAGAVARGSRHNWRWRRSTMVKIGVLTDMSSLYSDINGPGAVVATQMAIDDFGDALGKKIELIQADVQNKADVGTSIAGRWYSAENVDVILGAAASSSSLAVAGVAGDKKKVFLATDPASSDLTGKACNAYTIHWVYDTVALANGTGSAVVKAGGKTWYFMTADYAFGHALERDVTAVVVANGGSVIGHALHPINSSDFSAFLVQAQASKAQVVGLANAGGDTINSIKQAAEFGVRSEARRTAGIHHRRQHRTAAAPSSSHRGILLGPERRTRPPSGSREDEWQDADQHPGRYIPRLGTT